MAIRFVLMIALAAFLASCAAPPKPRPTAGPASEREKRLRELIESYGIEEREVAEFYLDHPEYAERYLYAPAVYRGFMGKMPRNQVLRTYFDMAIYAREEGDLDKAIYALKKAKKIKPDSPTLDYNLGVIHLEKGMVGKAIKHFKEAIEKAHSGDMVVDASINLAICYLRRGDLKGAEKALTDALDLAPDDPGLNYNLGVIYLRMKRFEEAFERFQKALVDDELELDARMGMGICLARMNRKEEALKEFRKVAQRRPNDPQIWYNIGVVAFQMGRLKAAKPAFERAARLGYDGREIADFLEAIEGMSARRARLAYNKGVSSQRLYNYREALSYYRKAVQLDPEMKEAYLNMAVCLDKLRRTAEAMEALKKAVEIDPRFFEARFNLGVLCLKMGRLEEAVEHLRKAALLRPYYSEAKYNLGIALYKLGRYEEAVERFKEVVELAPWWDDAHYNLAMTLLKLGRREEAISELEATLKINPLHRDAAEALNSLKAP